ncbi:MAG: hypothetical protein Q4F27_07155, partial [Desulfovibrionaceae bacterium]|nr:hypothetical protein [Desulfovibrionaceae bacterium]
MGKKLDDGAAGVFSRVSLTEERHREKDIWKLLKELCGPGLKRTTGAPFEAPVVHKLKVTGRQSSCPCPA